MFTNRSRIASLLVGLTLATSALAGCATSTVDPSAPTTESTDALASAAAPAPGHHHGHGGLIQRFEKSLAEVDVRADQKPALEQIRADLKAQRAPMREAHKQLQLALADGVAAGAIKDEALAAPLKQIEQASASFEASMQASLNKLHATLDAGQRKQLVEAMRPHHGDKAKMGEGEGEGKGGEGEGKWEGRKADREARGEGRGPGKGEHGGHARMEKLTKELALTDDQVRSIREGFKAEMGGARPAFAEHDKGGEKGAGREKMRALAQAFEGESFDAAALGVGKEMPEKARQAAAHEAHFVSRLVPVLTPAQRVKFAEILRAKAAAGGEGEQR